MTQRARIERAIKLLRPVRASVQDRCPKGVQPWLADRITNMLDNAISALENALDCYPHAAR